MDKHTYMQQLYMCRFQFLLQSFRLKIRLLISTHVSLFCAQNAERSDMSFSVHLAWNIAHWFLRSYYIHKKSSQIWEVVFLNILMKINHFTICYIYITNCHKYRVYTVKYMAKYMNRLPGMHILVVCPFNLSSFLCKLPFFKYFHRTEI